MGSWGFTSVIRPSVHDDGAEAAEDSAGGPAADAGSTRTSRAARDPKMARSSGEVQPGGTAATPARAPRRAPGQPGASGG